MSTSSCCDPLIVNIPGTPGADGAAGTAGAAGVSAYTMTTDSFLVPAGTDPVTILVQGTAWLPASPTTARFTLAVGNAGYFTLLSYGTGTITVRSLSTVAAGTAISAGQRVSVAGAPGQPGADGTSGAPATATFVVQTHDSELPNAQALSDLASGYAKITTATGVVSTVTNIPVADISGNWDLNSTTGVVDLTTKATGVLPMAHGGTQYAAANLADLQAYLGITAVSPTYFCRYLTADVYATLGTTSPTLLYTNANTTAVLDNATAWNAAGYYNIPNTGVYRVEVVCPYTAYTGHPTPSILQVYKNNAVVAGTQITEADGFVSCSTLVSCLANDRISIQLILTTGVGKYITATAGGTFLIQRVA